MKDKLIVVLSLPGLMLAFSGCTDSAGGSGMYQQPTPVLPVFQVRTGNAATTREFAASLEGTRNVEIRPQVDGYLIQIYQDEGAFVHKGQPLFKIDDKVYLAQLDNAKANVLSARAAEENAQLNVDKLKPLVQANVVSDVQLKAASAALDASRANVAQAEAMVRNASINVGYTTVMAPSDGYLGRIPFKMGSLVGRTDAQPLTILSENAEVYAYFSMSEEDFLAFKRQYSGATVEEKIRQMPPVELVLPDNSVYPEKGKVQTVEGMFDKTVGAIPFRALFPNPNGLLRSGNTGKLRMSEGKSAVYVVPQEATFELQDKVFVFALGDSNKVLSKPIAVNGRSGNYYLVSGGLKPGDRLVYTGLDGLRDGMTIVPTPMSLDSLIAIRPM